LGIAAADFLPAGCPSCCPTNSVRTLKENCNTLTQYYTIADRQRTVKNILDLFIHKTREDEAYIDITVHLTSSKYLYIIIYIGPRPVTEVTGILGSWLAERGIDRSRFVAKMTQPKKQLSKSDAPLYVSLTAADTLIATEVYKGGIYCQHTPCPEKTAPLNMLK